jgi:phosphoserine phosphatase
VRSVTPRQAIAAIETFAHEMPGGAIAFDGDGTLWAGDIGDDYFTAILEHGVLDTAREALVREAEREGIDARGTARDIAHRIHSAYLAGAFPEERVCEIMTWVSAGREREELDRFCAGVLEAATLRARFHAEALSVLEHARRVGWEAYIVSASPRAIVGQAARLLGVSPDHTVAVREVFDDRGLVTCAVERPIPYGPGKVSRLLEKLGARPLYAAFGDNAFDVPMLREASVRVAVRPKARLLDRAAEVPELVVLERASS